MFLSKNVYRKKFLEEILISRSGKVCIHRVFNFELCDKVQTALQSIDPITKRN